MIIIIAMLLGILIAMVLPADFSPPMAYSTYISVAFLAGLDSVIGAVRGGLANKFNLTLFVSGFLVNVLLAAFITWMGDRLGVDLYMAAIVTFGVRLFNNLGYIRRDLVVRFLSHHEIPPPDSSSLHMQEENK